MEFLGKPPNPGLTRLIASPSGGRHGYRHEPAPRDSRSTNKRSVHLRGGRAGRTDTATAGGSELALVLAGLPRPQAQVAIHDGQGRFLGRADLYYPAQRLILEYDGATHRTSLVEDNRRQNRLLNAGYRILRFTVADINGTPDALIAQVREALALSPTQRAAQRRNAW